MENKARSASRKASFILMMKHLSVVGGLGTRHEKSMNQFFYATFLSLLKTVINKFIDTIVCRERFHESIFGAYNAE